MKKYIKNILLAAVAVLSMTTFAACSSDDDPKGEEETKPTSGDFVYNFYLSETVLKVADIEITYTDCSGKEITEKVTADKCSTDITDGEPKTLGATMCYTKEIKTTSLPATSGYKMTWTVKTGGLTEEKFIIPHGMNVLFKPNIGSTYKTMNAVKRASVTLDQMDDFIILRNKSDHSTYTATTEGTLEKML